MRNIAVHLIDLGMSSLGRRPVLTVLIAYSVAFAVAALIVTLFAERRDTTCNPNSGRADHLYMALATPASRSDALARSVSPASIYAV